MLRSGLQPGVTAIQLSILPSPIQLHEVFVRSVIGGEGIPDTHERRYEHGSQYGDAPPARAPEPGQGFLRKRGRCTRWQPTVRRDKRLGRASDDYWNRGPRLKL